MAWRTWNDKDIERCLARHSFDAFLFIQAIVVAVSTCHSQWVVECRLGEFAFLGIRHGRKEVAEIDLRTQFGEQ